MAWSSRIGAFVLALGWASTASATNTTKPVVVATFPAAECLTTISRREAETIRIGIPYEDVGATPDEPPGSRRLQLFATCRDAEWLEELPTWISRGEATTAAAFDPTVVPPEPEDVLDEAPAWNGPGHDGSGSACVIPINAADDRVAISCEETADGIAWDARDVPPGAYAVWSYTYEGARSLWSPARIVVRVVDEDPDEAPPAVAFSSPVSFGAMSFESGILVEGCAAGAPGTVLTLSWATTEELADDPDDAWVELAVQEAAGPFAVPFMPPERALRKGVVFRAEVVDPQGRSFAVLGPDYMEVRGGCGEPFGGAPLVVDECGVAVGEDEPVPVAAADCDAAPAGDESGGDEPSGDASSGDTASSGSETGQIVETDTDGAMEATQVESGCGCSTPSERGSVALFVVFGALVLRRRRKRDVR